MPAERLSERLQPWAWLGPKTGSQHPILVRIGSSPVGTLAKPGQHPQLSAFRPMPRPWTATDAVSLVGVTKEGCLVALREDRPAAMPPTTPFCDGRPKADAERSNVQNSRSGHRTKRPRASEARFKTTLDDRTPASWPRSSAYRGQQGPHPPPASVVAGMQGRRPRQRAAEKAARRQALRPSV